METTGGGTQVPESTESAVMKSLTLGIVGELGRMLKEFGLGRQPIRIIELIVFAMFVVTETYTSAKRGLESARGGLDRFHEDMTEYIFTEYFFKTTKAKDMAEVEARFQDLSELVNDRYQEYRRNFYDDYYDKEMRFQRTFNSLANHLLQETLPEGEEKDRMIAAFSVKLAHFWSGCLSSFQPMAG